MNGWTFALMLAIVLAISIFATLYKPAAEYIRDVFTSITDIGAVGYVILILVQAMTVVCAIPIIVPNMALSALFSFPMAFLLSMTGYTLALCIIYSMMATCKWEPGSDTFKRLHGVMKHEPFKYTLLARFIMMPAGLKNYGLACCPISFWVYLSCSFIHGIYVNGLQVATAAQLWTAKSLLNYMVLVGTFLIGMGSLILFSYLAHRAIRQGEEREAAQALLQPGEQESERPKTDS